MTWAILFSKPSCFWLENGKFSGSAQTRKRFTSAPKAYEATNRKVAVIVSVVFMGPVPGRPEGLHYYCRSADLRVCREYCRSADLQVCRASTAGQTPSTRRPGC